MKCDLVALKPFERNMNLSSPVGRVSFTSIARDKAYSDRVDEEGFETGLKTLLKVNYSSSIHLLCSPSVLLPTRRNKTSYSAFHTYWIEQLVLLTYITEFVHLSLLWLPQALGRVWAFPFSVSVDDAGLWDLTGWIFPHLRGKSKYEPVLLMKNVPNVFEPGWMLWASWSEWSFRWPMN